MYLNQDIPNRKTLYQVPGGRLAEVFGTRRVFGYSMLVCAALAAATQPGQPALLPADLDRVRTSDQYIVRAWKHVFGTDQKFPC